jgi:hypothetical protein
MGKPMRMQMHISNTFWIYVKPSPKRPYAFDFPLLFVGKSEAMVLL